MEITNGHVTTCPHCNHHDWAVTQDNAGKEFAVCYHCGAVEAKQKFDALRYLTNLMHDGVEKPDELVEVLNDKIGDVYYWLDGVDVELLAKMLMQTLYDEAKFTAMAENQEAYEMEAERREAIVGAY